MICPVLVPYPLNWGSCSDLGFETTSLQRPFNGKEHIYAYKRNGKGGISQLGQTPVGPLIVGVIESRADLVLPDGLHWGTPLSLTPLVQLLAYSQVLTY